MDTRVVRHDGRETTVSEPAPIEIIVLTYNRAHLLRETLGSIVQQTKRPCRVRVLDNGSSDDTPDLVRSFAPQGVELVRNERNDPRGCWARMQSMAEAPWVMLFHDDDLLHPECIERLHAATQWGREASLAVTLMRAFRDQAPEFPRSTQPVPQRMSAAELASRLYRGLAVPFCTTVYRREALQRATIETSVYGKIFDRPLMLAVASMSSALLVPEPLVLYRLHATQDSVHRASGPFPSEVIALQRMYRGLLGESPLSSHGRSFLRRNRRNLVNDHATMQGTPGWSVSLEKFLQDAMRAGGASHRSLAIGEVYAALTEWPRLLEGAIRRFRCGAPRA